MKIIKYWCKLFGHDYGFIEKIIFELEMKAINRYQLKPEIKCKNCGHIVRGYK